MIDDLLPAMYRHIRKKVAKGRPSYRPSKIIDRFISKCVNNNDKIALMDFKVSILREFGSACDLKESINQSISLNPLAPEPWINLIIFFRDDMEDESKSLIACDIAISISLLDGNFTIQCLTEKVRTAIHFRDFEKATEAIERLIAHRRLPESLDESYQLDFLNHPNASLIPANVSSRYITHVKGHRKSQ